MAHAIPVRHLLTGQGVRLTDVRVAFDVGQRRAAFTLYRTIGVLTVSGLPHVRCALPDFVAGLQLTNAITHWRVRLTNVRVTIRFGQRRAVLTLHRTVRFRSVFGLPHVRSTLPDLITGLQLPNAITHRRIRLTVVRIARLVRQRRARRALNRTVGVPTVFGLPHVRRALPDFVAQFQLADPVTRWRFSLTVIRVTGLLGQSRSNGTNDVTVDPCGATNGPAFVRIFRRDTVQRQTLGALTAWLNETAIEVAAKV